VPSSASIADGAVGRPAPWRNSQTKAAQSRSSVSKRRDPSWALAAWVSDGAKVRSDPGQRRSSSAAHARCCAPVASIPITGGSPTPLAVISRAKLLDAVAQHRQRHRLADQPRSPVVNHTRLLTLPGSIATTSRSPAPL
jgi:hypothetical protein